MKSIINAMLIAGLAAPSQIFAVGVEISGPTMGTYFKVVIDSPPEEFDGEALRSKIDECLESFNAQMSTWDSDSEISKFNASSTTDWFPVSQEFARVTEQAKAVYEVTNGAFDPTVEPLIRLWGFGDDREQKVPSGDEIAKAKAQTGMQHLAVRLDPPSIKKSIPELQLNLSAIAKGTAVDAVAQLLNESGYTSFVVDIGGENRVGVAKADGSPWRLGVESPLGGLQRVVPLTEKAIATSGDYRNYFEMDGETYSHAIDPTTGWPVKNPPAAVSVIADSCESADAWATAMMVLGPEKSVDLANAQGLSVLFQKVVDDSVRETTTGAFSSSDTAEPAVSVEEASASAAPGESAEADDSAAPWFPFVAAAVIFLVAIGGMAVGTMLQNKSLKGSCGGLASMPGSEGKSICELCTIPKDECTNTELREQMQAAAAARECEEHSNS